MKTFEQFLNSSLTKYDISTLCRTESAVFLDIETTGLSREKSCVYLIGLAIPANGGWQLKQLFIPSRAEEGALLDRLRLELAPFDFLITFNGDKFDLPFIKERCRLCGADDFISKKTSIDLYKKIFPFKRALCLSSLRQKEIESFLAIKRSDTLSGRELIKLYLSYEKNPDGSLLRLILLHNAEDIEGMLSLLDIFFYIDTLSYRPSSAWGEVRAYRSLDGQPAEELLLSFDSPYPLPAPHLLPHDPLYLYLSKDVCTIRCPLFRGQLKHFFEDYKNYYYLPLEDTAIHRSVGAGVDRSSRENAKPYNCYTRRDGLFAPDFTGTKHPSFRSDFKDKQLFFEVTDDFLQSSERLGDYAFELMKQILTAPTYHKT